MKIRPSILLIAGAFGCAAALAQGSQEARIIRAAVDFVRGDMPVGAIMVDADMLHADTAVADEVSRQLGAGRGRYQDAIHCEARPEGGKMCTLSGLGSVLGFDRPKISGKTATVTVGWRFQGAPGRISWKHLQLELVQSSEGIWRVSQVLSRGMS